ncbi:MAG: hypothetical protein WC223_00775 [Bacteroidales bacterium]|jgi:hypothetical protein
MNHYIGKKTIKYFPYFLVICVFLFTRIPFYVLFPLPDLNEDFPAYFFMAKQLYYGQLPRFDVLPGAFSFFCYLVFCIKRSIFLVMVLQSLLFLFVSLLSIRLIEKHFNKFKFFFIFLILILISDPNSLTFETKMMTESISRTIYFVLTVLLVISLSKKTITNGILISIFIILGLFARSEGIYTFIIPVFFIILYFIDKSYKKITKSVFVSLIILCITWSSVNLFVYKTLFIPGSAYEIKSLKAGVRINLYKELGYPIYKLNPIQLEGIKQQATEDKTRSLNKKENNIVYRFKKFNNADSGKRLFYYYEPIKRYFYIWGFNNCTDTIGYSRLYFYLIPEDYKRADDFNKFTLNEYKENFLIKHEPFFFRYTKCAYNLESEKGFGFWWNKWLGAVNLFHRIYVQVFAMKFWILLFITSFIFSIIQIIKKKNVELNILIIFLFFIRELNLIVLALHAALYYRYTFYTEFIVYLLSIFLFYNLYIIYLNKKECSTIKP